MSTGQQQTYPVTTMSPEELARIYSACMLGTTSFPVALTDNSLERMYRFVNAIIRHAIDSGIVAPPEAYAQCAADLLQAEDVIRRITDLLRASNRSEA